MSETPAHEQHFTHSYWVTYPAHEPRQEDPHYKDFTAYHRKNRPTARCAMGQRLGYRYCADEHGQPAQPRTDGFQPGLELHHAHIEFALQNAVDLALLEKDYPGISNPDEVGAWVESGANLVWLCTLHHRGAPGVHSATASDWEASHYIRDLISKDEPAPSPRGSEG